MYRPLADQLRPLALDDVVGQRHLIGENGILRRIIESGSIPNMIFYGPSGVGKTTLASIIANQTQRKLYKLNATTASLQDIKAIVDELDTFLAPQGVLLYLDEIQYFNKKQQQSLLEFMENGKITLIASTTENPYFYIYNAILSRSTVFEFKPVTPEDVAQAVRRAFSLQAKAQKQPISLEEGVSGPHRLGLRRGRAQIHQRGGAFVLSRRAQRRGQRFVRLLGRCPGSDPGFLHEIRPGWRQPL